MGEQINWWIMKELLSAVPSLLYISLSLSQKVYFYPESLFIRDNWRFNKADPRSMVPSAEALAVKSSETEVSSLLPQPDTKRPGHVFHVAGLQEQVSGMAWGLGSLWTVILSSAFCILNFSQLRCRSELCNSASAITAGGVLWAEKVRFGIRPGF